MLSTLWAYSFSGAWEYRNRILVTTTLIIFISLYADTKREIDITLISIVLSSAILAVVLLINTPLEQWGDERLGREVGMNANSLGMLFAYAATICLYFIKKNKLFLMLFILFGTISLFSGSRKAFVLLLLATVILFFNTIKKPSNILYIIPFGALFFSLIYFTMNNPILYHILGRRIMGLLNAVSGEGRVDHSTIVRLDLINIGIEQFKIKPLIGYGLNSYRFMNKYKLYAHNNYIELLVSAGLIGTVLYYAMPLIILFRSTTIWLTKTRAVILPILFMIIMFVSDYGVVSYYSQLNLIILTVSYRITAIYSDHVSKLDSSMPELQT